MSRPQTPTGAEIGAFVRDALAGRRCSGARLGYGDPLLLDFAAVGDDAGGCSLETHFADWRIDGVGTAAGELTHARADLERAVAALPDRAVTDWHVEADGRLCIELADVRLAVTPWPADDGRSDAWCVGGSEGELLACSTDRRFAIVGSTTPVADWFPRRV